MTEAGVIKYNKLHHAVYSVRYSSDAQQLAVGYDNGCLEVHILLTDLLRTMFNVSVFSAVCITINEMQRFNNACLVFSPQPLKMEIGDYSVW